ncbi:MAG: prolipoprotein diacylglyceryl transferase [Alphaproteobacteria bacterium]|nr:prolipoprotein diacylglyceryl transferase [Alphaproteobacteria bacterium]
MTGLEFPAISPVIFAIGPIAVRWYSMAYLVGIVAAWLLILRLIKKYDLPLTRQQVEDMVFFTTIGIVVGGRLGYVLFYGGEYYLHNPLKIFAIWQGGMSFHGGAIGAVMGILYTAYSQKIKFWLLTDMAALFAPIGIFLGRIANFINDELWGRVTDVPWAVRFPSGGFLPRHPSQLYEAVTEGLIIFIVLNLLWKKQNIRKNNGVISALFVIMYGFFRMLMEYYRQPDEQLGFFFGYITMGQILSLPVLLFGLSLLWYFCFKKPQK